MTFPSPTPRRVSRPRWLDLRLVLGVVLVLAAVLIGAKVVSSAKHTEQQLAVTHDLAAGTALTATDVTMVDVQLPGTAHVYVDDSSKVIGKVLNRSLTQGELVPMAALGVAPARTTVSVPFAADAAPKLARGERIVVWLSTASCPSIVLLPDVTVQDVRTADDANFSTAGSGQDVVLAVDPDLAQRVVSALAIDGATIRAGGLSGAPAPKSATGLLSLSACGAAAPR